MRSERAKDMLQQFYEIKRAFQLPLKIRLYFSTLEDLIDKKTLRDFTKQQIVDQMLIKAFLTHSDEEKIAFLLALITFLKSYYDRQINHQPAERNVDSQGPTINHIETSCQLQIFSFKLSLWTNAKFKFDKLRRSVSISNKKRNIVLSLNHYLVRKSTRHDYSLVLDAISKEVSQENVKVVLFFKQEIFVKVFKELVNCVTDIQKEALLTLIKNSEDDHHDGGESTMEKHHDKSLVFLSSEQVTFYLKYKAHICQRLQVGGFAFKNIYVKYYDKESVRIDRSLSIDKIFKLQFQVKKTLAELKQEFIEKMQNNYKYKVNSSVIEQFSKKYKAVYDRYLINNKIYEQISLKEQCVTEKEEIFFSKGVQNIMTNNHLEFMLIKVKPTQRADANKVVLVVSLVLSKQINLEIAIAYLLEFYDMLFRVKQKEVKQMQQMPQDNEDDFYTILSDNKMEEQLFQFQQSDQLQDSKFEQPQQPQQLQLKKDKIASPQNHLGRIDQTPLQLNAQQLKAKRLSEHFLFNQWTRCKNGGVVCINQTMLVQQKKMIKKILGSIGSNIHKIIKTGGVLNMSLPVTIFKKESHLQSIGLNFCYAPLLFDPFRNNQKDSYQRFKAAILFTISVNNLGISAQKPFNPILGETLQCWIAGCPLYLQQISHHPFNASYYFVGRGYKIYGQIDPKIGMGINSGKCSSEKPNYIEFDDGTKICLVYGKMVIKGLIFGDRQFHFQDKVYVYDMKNHYFAELFFGPRKRGYYISKGDPDDYTYGKIYRTTSAYLPKFKQKVPPIFPTTEDISKQLSTIQGIWNQSVKIDDKEYFNFATQLPYKLQYEPHPLPSNSTFRKDLTSYIQGDIEKAQEQKEIMEQIQRRDRKLRETKK